MLDGGRFVYEAIDGVKTDVIEVEENVHISCPAASDTTAWMQFDMGGERDVYKVRVKEPDHFFVSC